jgi:Rod binding domain-containing protein
MPISSINPHAKVNPTDIPLEKLATSKALTEEQKTSEMTRQFEAVLLRQILNEAQKPAVQSKYASTGVTSAIYQDMMVNQLADRISSSRTVGLAQELQSQVSRQNNAHGAKATPASTHAPIANHSHNSDTKTKPAGSAVPLSRAPRL